MADILGLGLSHYPPLCLPDAEMAGILKWTLQDASIPAREKDVASWPAPMRAEWADDDGARAAAAHRKALIAAVQGRGNSNLGLLAVTVLTNFDTHDLRDMGIQRSLEDLVTARAALADQVGCDGVVASGKEPEAIRTKVGPRLQIVTPGVRPLGKGTDDHARVTTPSQTIASGADYLVVGRPIRDAADPAAAASNILAEMQTAFEARHKREGP